MQQTPKPLAQVPDLIPPLKAQSLELRHVPLFPVWLWQGSFLKETIVKRDKTEIKTFISLLLQNITNLHLLASEGCWLGSWWWWWSDGRELLDSICWGCWILLCFDGKIWGITFLLTICSPWLLINFFLNTLTGPPLLALAPSQPCFFLLTNLLFTKLSSSSRITWPTISVMKMMCLNIMMMRSWQRKCQSLTEEQWLWCHAAVSHNSDFKYFL